jgi:hypothetical protein
MLQEKTTNALKWIIEILNKKNIPYQITGGLAAKIYGSPRPLNDIDIDIPEDKFTNIMTAIEPYIIFGPEYMNDGKWDTKLITLNFKGQEMDIGGAYETKISNKNRTIWIPYPIDFSQARKIEVGGISLNVMAPEKLIEYKKNLDGVHQLVDINAVKKFLLSYA